MSVTNYNNNDLINEEDKESVLTSPRLYLGRRFDKEHANHGKWELWFADFMEPMAGHILVFDTLEEALMEIPKYLEFVATHYPERWKRWTNNEFINSNYNK